MRPKLSDVEAGSISLTVSPEDTINQVKVTMVMDEDMFFKIKLFDQYQRKLATETP